MCVLFVSVHVHCQGFIRRRGHPGIPPSAPYIHVHVHIQIQIQSFIRRRGHPAIPPFSTIHTCTCTCTLSEFHTEEGASWHSPFDSAPYIHVHVHIQIQIQSFIRRRGTLYMYEPTIFLDSFRTLTSARDRPSPIRDSTLCSQAVHSYLLLPQQVRSHDF